MPGTFRPSFELLREIGDVPLDDYRRTFNLGIGMILVDLEEKPHEGAPIFWTAWTTNITRSARVVEVAALARDLEMIRLGILISGRGSNFEAIAFNIKAKQAGCANRGGHFQSCRCPWTGEGESRTEFPPFAFPSKGVPREEYDRQVVAELKAHDVELVCLAGYMRLLSPAFIREFPLRILNIHPSLLPSFPGLDAQEQALHHGVKVSGCTVHFVDQDLDAGPIVLQAAVPVMDNDTAQTLSARILREEHRIYSEAIALVASGKFRVEGRRVIRVVGILDISHRAPRGAGLHPAAGLKPAPRPIANRPQVANLPHRRLRTAAAFRWSA